jgi:hypothetical protein
MIAHVFTYRRSAGPESEEMRAFLEKAVSEARAFDGCEAVVAMRDPATGEALSINLLRDQAAMDAWQTFSNEQRVEGEKVAGPAGATARAYTEVIARL